MYAIHIENRCLRELKRLDRAVLRRVLQAIRHTLPQDPYAGKRLKGRYAGLYRYRVADYRIIYAVFSRRLVVSVLRVRHRKDAYDGL